MKADRLYALTLYLLNHGRTPASELAKHFEVSIRTVQRDIDTLCQAGIPICAFTGINGGYEILQDFKMNNQLVSEEEYAYITTAISGLKTVTNNPVADDIYEKITAISRKSNTGMILDFSALREGDDKLLLMLQSAVKNKQVIRFTYTNNGGETREHCVEPIAVIYKWYAWYMLEYNTSKQDYRTYKLVRMEKVFITEDRFSREHKSAQDILNDRDHSYHRKNVSTKVRMRCRDNAIHRIKEYLNGQLIEAFEDGTVIMEIHIVENEQWWIGVVLSQGKEVEVIEPEHIKERIINSAKDILFLYENYDIEMS
ncbi:MAG: YafY family transcriptional regulator [Lachnospiraceae bacterium]|nr:YafY family transcriptional regulator [Lachnospiraceae bacterium]